MRPTGDSTTANCRTLRAGLVLVHLALLPGLVPMASADQTSPLPNVYAITVAEGLSVTRDQFFGRYGTQLGLGSRDQMVLMQESPSFVPGDRLAYYEQRYSGLPVLGSGYSLSLRNGQVLSGLGRLVPGITSGTLPTVTAAQALSAAKRKVQNLFAAAGQPAPVFAAGASCRLVIAPAVDFDNPMSYRLAYECPLRLTVQHTAYTVAVDAMAAGSASTLWAVELVSHAWQPATAEVPSEYHGQLSAAAERESANGTYRLKSDLVHVLDGRPADLPGGNGNLAMAVDFLDPDGRYEAADQKAAGASLWGLHEAMAAARDLFATTCDYGGLAQGLPLAFYYFAGPDPLLAFSTQERYIYTVHPAGAPSLASLDALAHEVGHCLTTTPALTALGAQYPIAEGGAIREGFSDAFGEIVENHVLGANDWMAGGALTGAGLSSIPRYLDDPTASYRTQPDRYREGPNWIRTDQVCTAANDRCGAHMNNGPFNKWFYLLADGSSYSFPGLGLERARDLLWAGVREKLVLNYPSAREATLQAAAERCGDYATERNTVWAAWYNVGVGDVATAPTPWTQPAADGVGVQPWPVDLRWRRGNRESSWRVQVAADDTFTELIHDAVVATTAQQPGIGTVGRTTLNLSGGKEIWWRVRAEGLPGTQGADAETACWRPAQRFQTAAVTTTPSSPVTLPRVGVKHHPWELEFNWSAVPRAESYTLEVSRDSQFTSGGRLFPVVTVAGTSTFLDVLVAKTLYWRVRPTAHADGNGPAASAEGNWSATRMFETTKPVVSVIKPAGNALVYPWPVQFEWSPVRGADHFLIEAQPYDSFLWNPDAQHREWFEVPPEVTAKEYFFPADHDVELFQWRVRVVGPALRESGIVEEGTAGVSTFRLDTDATVPARLSPVDGCVDAGLLKLRFQGVREATRYKIVVGKWDLSPVDGSTWNLYAQDVRFEQPATDPSGNTVEEAFHTPADWFFGDDEGFYWYAEAVGPQGIAGHPVAIDSPTDQQGLPHVLLQPTVPQLVSPANGEEFARTYDFDVVWQSGFTHNSQSRHTLYSGGSCSGPVVTTLIPTDEHDNSGISTLRVHGTSDSALPQTYSWDVRPRIFPVYSGAACAAPQRSACRSYVIGGHPSVPRAPQVPAECYSFTYSCDEPIFADALGLVFENLAGAESYEVEVREGSSQGAIVFSGAWTVLELQMFADEVANACEVGIDSVVNWIAIADGLDPLTTHVYRARACDAGTAQCGAWSLWATWGPDC